jgi:hypothetical protein
LNAANRLSRVLRVLCGAVPTNYCPGFHHRHYFILLLNRGQFRLRWPTTLSARVRESGRPRLPILPELRLLLFIIFNHAILTRAMMHVLAREGQRSSLSDGTKGHTTADQ